VRIPLDYYRILGLPIQATHEQLRQAHRDRTLQLPRREYSDAAIAARKQLLDQAYAILSNSEQRQIYDATFLAKTYDQAPELDNYSATNDHRPVASSSSNEPAALFDAQTPNIDINDEQFMGALLILQELGEYELVLKLGRPFLTGGTASLKEGRYGNPTIVASDIVLTVALACLELGREQWQQNQYENAAEALETGQQLLLREGLFLNVRGEIQSDLYRLRPYRVLELLSMPENCLEERQVGMGLLQEMLRERGGIDGTENDQSGLSIDDFLRFIQQLRSYLTAEEQHYLFEQEANRPSAVATYLTVYALLARGFAARQPTFVQKAKQYLQRIGGRQDVYLEQAICALLLGQTEDASQALEQSQEQDSLHFIRQHSQGSPDLLPGLCLYTDRWFQDEVFPHFRDLVESSASLKNYFADRRVQLYLEDLPTDAVDPVEPIQPVHATAPKSPTWRQAIPAPAVVPAPTPVPRVEEPVQPLVSLQPDANPMPESNSNRDSLIAIARERIASRQAGGIGNEGRFASGVSTAERVTEPVSAEIDGKEGSRPASTVNGTPISVDEGGDSDMPNRRVSDRRTRTKWRAPQWLMPLLVLLGIMAIGVSAAWLFRTSRSPIQQTAQTDKTLTNPSPGAQPTPSPITPPDFTAIPTLDKASAKLFIEGWLTAKSKAMGPKHQIEALDQILTEPSLSKWRTDAEKLKSDGEHRVYTHSVTEVESVEMLALTPLEGSTDEGIQASPSPAPTPTSTPGSPETSASPTPSPGATSTPATGTPLPSPEVGKPSGTVESAKIVALISEATEIFKAGKSEAPAQPENLRVQYNVVRKEGKWRIQDWQILN
jgi:ARC6-like, IMS domain/DnaJ domain